MEKLPTAAPVLIVLDLREHVAEDWQALLASHLAKVHAVSPLETGKLSSRARVDVIRRVLERIYGAVILVAHSAGVMMVAHWAARYRHAIKGALLAASLNLAANRWGPLPAGLLPFPSIVAASRNDHLARHQAVARRADTWGGEQVDVGAVGHLNPAAGFGHWPRAEAFIAAPDQD